MKTSLTMFIVVDKNLPKTNELCKKWNAGSFIAQACHAATAVLHKTRDDPDTIEYVSNTDNMTKVILKSRQSVDIPELASRLEKHKVPFYAWTEMPENVVSALATAPLVERSKEVKAIFQECCTLYS